MRDTCICIAFQSSQACLKKQGLEKCLLLATIRLLGRLGMPFA